MAQAHAYYLVTGALNMGDTPGVFMDAQFVGLLLQIPVTITFLPDGSDPVKLLLMTTEVEVFNGKKPCVISWLGSRDSTAAAGGPTHIFAAPCTPALWATSTSPGRSRRCSHPMSGS